MSKGSDINVSSIEEDIEILKNIIEVYESCSVPEIDMQVDITFGKKEVNAIKTILGNLEALCDMQMAADRELKNAKQINEEHQKINGELREKVKELDTKNYELLKDLYSANCIIADLTDSIPKQKIKNKIEELIIQGNYKTFYNPNGRTHFLKEESDYKIEVLQEVLQEEDK